MTNPIFVALDVREAERALAIARSVSPYVGGFKLGLEYFCAHGPAGVSPIRELGLPLFLDLKLHDIPRTVTGAVRSLAPLAPEILTVHAAGGAAMMEAAKAAAGRFTKVVGVSILTSLDSGDLEAIGMGGTGTEPVLQLARLACASGLDGLVCSGLEVAEVRKIWADGVLVVPGIRLQGTGSVDQKRLDDQKRVLGPADAMKRGASILVVGRPITDAVDPAAAAALMAEGWTSGRASHSEPGVEEFAE